MSLRITFELEEHDLEYFRKQMTRARKVAKETTEEEVRNKAADALKTVRSNKIPEFVEERLNKIQSLIDMLGDAEWNLEDGERRNVVTALTYFAEPEDIIPDNIPVIGYIDDAIMIELVVRDLTNEIDAYEDFCAYRRSAPSDQSSREAWLESKRRQLFARMRRRRQRGHGPSGRTRFRLF